MIIGAIFPLKNLGKVFLLVMNKLNVTCENFIFIQL